MWIIMSVYPTSRYQSELTPCCLINMHRLLRCRPIRCLCDSGRCTFLFCKQQDSIVAHVEALNSTCNCRRVLFRNTDNFVVNRIGGRNWEIFKLLHLPRYLNTSNLQLEMVIELRNWEYVDRSDSWPVSMYYSVICVGGLKEITRSPSQGGRRSSWDLNQVSPNYQSWILHRRSTCWLPLFYVRMHLDAAIRLKTAKQSYTVCVCGGG
jgi:hypothetical protein